MDFVLSHEAGSISQIEQLPMCFVEHPDTTLTGWSVFVRFFKTAHSRSEKRRTETARPSGIILRPEWQNAESSGKWVGCAFIQP